MILSILDHSVAQPYQPTATLASLYCTDLLFRSTPKLKNVLLNVKQQQLQQYKIFYFIEQLRASQFDLKSEEVF